MSLGRCNNVAEMLHNEVRAFTRWASPTPVEDETRGLVVQHISQAITDAFPDANVLPFGSYGTKLYLPSGDIDLVVVSKTMAYSNRTNVLYAVANAMRRAGVTDTKVTVISKARVPIVKFVTTHGRFNVDISINQESGLLAGNIINSFMKDMVGCELALRSLIMITKAFLAQRSMNEVFTGGLGSYSIVCMAISFLQMHPKIRRGEIDPAENLGVLLMEFFEFYGHNFNFVTVGLSLRDGGTYFRKVDRWSDFSSAQLLSIEDPADPTNDISKGSYQYPKVRQTFAGAYDILLSTVYYLAGVLSSKREGRYTKIHEEETSEDISILASIIAIPQETINRRTLVQELYDSRKLNIITGIPPRATTDHQPPECEPSPPTSVVDVVEVARDENAKAKAEVTHDDGEEHDRAVGNDMSIEDDEDPDEAEEGRYGIGRPKKVRRIEFTGADTTTDEEEEETEEQGELSSKSAAPDEEKETKVRRQADKQAFWSSKGSFDREES